MNVCGRSLIGFLMNYEIIFKPGNTGTNEVFLGSQINIE
jgi:hypothetical protein